MSEDTIVVNIDDSQLSDVLMRLQLLGAMSKETTGRKRLDLVLPGINRELRLILGQVPFMRDFMRGYFGLKRLERGKAYFAIGETTPAILAVIATLVMIVRFVDKRLRDIERREEQYRVFIRRQRGWSVEDYARLTGTLESYYRSDPG